MDGLSSTFSFTIFALLSNCCASDSTMGVIARQGGHHSAQKSTRTGTLLFITSVSKVPSVMSFKSSLINLLLAKILNRYKVDPKALPAGGGPVPANT